MSFTSKSNPSCVGSAGSMQAERQAGRERVQRGGRWVVVWVNGSYQ